MSQTLVKNHLHIVFSTKDRLPLISEMVAPKLFGYMSGICRNLECHADIIGGHIDHVHVLTNLSKNIALSRFLQELKVGSSKWIKTQNNSLNHFKWQNGYSAISVSPGHVETVRRYIENQREHHEVVTYKDELRKLLIDNNIPFDERYLWD